MCHLAPTASRETAYSNPVDGENVPVPHFGVVLNMQDWQELAERFKAADVSFVIEAFNDIERQLFET